GPSAFLRL
uniref:Extended FMRFamide-3 n=1 Tax=Hemilobophasma montaguense TaxID=253130 RepID=FAR3_HEMMO|nr:RecName: Full=Extended FMRFamide-3; Short=FMRFa-3 [Hemilobophasma montaguense]